MWSRARHSDKRIGDLEIDLEGDLEIDVTNGNQHILSIHDVSFIPTKTVRSLSISTVQLDRLSPFFAGLKHIPNIYPNCFSTNLPLVLLISCAGYVRVMMRLVDTF